MRSGGAGSTTGNSRVTEAVFSGACSLCSAAPLMASSLAAWPLAAARRRSLLDRFAIASLPTISTASTARWGRARWRGKQPRFAHALKQ
jgi:hypothetical protein